MRKVDTRIDAMLCEAGFVRMGDTEAGARYINGSDTVTVSGYFVFLRHHGFIKPYALEKALHYGVTVMQRICNLSSAEVEHRQQRRLNYEIPTTRRF